MLPVLLSTLAYSMTMEKVEKKSLEKPKYQCGFCSS